MLTDNKRESNTLMWLATLLCAAIVIFALCAGAAYSSIREARFSAAKASVGQIEAVLYLAERYAEDNGYGHPPTSYAHLLKSYDDADNIDLTAQERFVLDAMLDSFGQERDFDFAITRYEDVGGVHTQVYFFPQRGKTDARTDHYYLMTDGKIEEKNA